MEFRQLQHFLGVASELHFSKAAERLFITQPALSRQIQQLEEHLGVLLFERDKRNVRLTSAGEYLRDEASQILSQLEHISKRTQLIHKGEEGEIRLGYPGSAVYSVIPALLSNLQLHFPSIKSKLSEVLEDDLFGNLKNYQLDVGFIREPFSDKQITSKVIFEECFSLVLPENHEITPENFISLAQVKDEPFILPPRYAGSVYYDMLVRMCERVGFVPNVVHESNFGATILRLVEHNLGVSLMPISYRHSTATRIKFIELTDIPERTHLSMAWRKDDTNPVLQNFLKVSELIRFNT
ncbi:MAG: LysR substrate-binding domain-containing protein [Bacteroidota bacterium]|jgi:DNA-binding transcriptional LysR family regulator